MVNWHTSINEAGTCATMHGEVAAFPQATALVECAGVTPARVASHSVPERKLALAMTAETHAMHVVQQSFVNNLCGLHHERRWFEFEQRDGSIGQRTLVYHGTIQRIAIIPRVAPLLWCQKYRLKRWCSGHGQWAAHGSSSCFSLFS